MKAYLFKYYNGEQVLFAVPDVFTISKAIAQHCRKCPDYWFVDYYGCKIKKEYEVNFWITFLHYLKERYAEIPQVNPNHNWTFV